MRRGGRVHRAALEHETQLASLAQVPRAVERGDLGLILPFTVVEILQLRGSIHCLQTISVRSKWQIIYGLDSGFVKFQIKFFVKYKNIVAGIDDAITRSGYTTHDVSAKIKPSLGSDWTYFVAVDNLTDKYYGVHSTIASSSDDSVYRREMGRNFKVSVKYDF